MDRYRHEHLYGAVYADVPVAPCPLLPSPLPPPPPRLPMSFLFSGFLKCTFVKGLRRGALSQFVEAKWYIEQSNGMV